MKEKETMIREEAVKGSEGERRLIDAGQEGKTGGERRRKLS